MKKLEVFDPAMCCSTGVCGPDVDPVLPRFAADLEWLKTQGIQVNRYNLSQEPAAFANNEVVKSVLTDSGVKSLPMILLDGVLLSKGEYPSREKLGEWTGVQVDEVQAASSCCCCGPSECC